MSEPMVNCVAKKFDPSEMTWRVFDLVKMSQDLLESGLVIQCKGMAGKTVFIKPRSMALANLKFMQFPQVKNMVMYREPVANMRSIASLCNGMPKIMRLAMPLKKFCQSVIEGAYDEEVVDKVGQEVQDHQKKYGVLSAFALLFYIGHMLYVRDTNPEIKKHWNILKYERLMQNPEQEVRNLLSHLGCQDASPELIQLCLNTLEEDSQVKSDVLSRQKLTKAGGSKQLLPDNFKEFANEAFLRFGLPSIDNYDSLFR